MTLSTSGKVFANPLVSFNQMEIGGIPFVSAIIIRQVADILHLSFGPGRDRTERGMLIAWPP